MESVSRCLTTEGASKLAELEIDADLQDRIDELADRNTDGNLSDTEREELESYVRVGNFIAILQAKARKRIGAPEAA